MVFFNDVYLHAADILEVVYQHVKNGAGITTAMDWWKKRPEYYYDIWVGRTVSHRHSLRVCDRFPWIMHTLTPDDRSTRAIYSILLTTLGGLHRPTYSPTRLTLVQPIPTSNHSKSFHRGMLSPCYRPNRSFLLIMSVSGEVMSKRESVQQVSVR